MNISSAICHGTQRPGEEEKRAHVTARLSDDISMDARCVGTTVVTFICLSTEQHCDVPHFRRDLVATAHIWSKSTLLGVGGLSLGLMKLRLPDDLLLCHQQICGPCGTLRHCSSIFGRKLR